jgi:hypothetical protein
MDKQENAGTNWRQIGRIVLKAAILFLILNLTFAALQPLESLGQLSLYNWLLKGRERLPYGEDPSISYNLSLNNIPAMFASHEVSQSKAEDEFRVIIIGDSGTWGWLLENEDTLAGQINQGGYRTEDGRRIVAYNLGYPIMALSKDLLILDAALEYEPDLILWPVTMESLPKDKQLVPPLVLENKERIQELVGSEQLEMAEGDSAFPERNWFDETIIGRRRELADLIRLQLYGFSWHATGIDQEIPSEIQLRKSDFDEDLSWSSFEEPASLTGEDLSLDILASGVTKAGDIPVLLVNEPIFVSQGENSDIRYNAWYPRWAYDQYRRLLAERAEVEGWDYLDLWDGIDADEFTDSPVHLTDHGMREFAGMLAPKLLELADRR